MRKIVIIGSTHHNTYSMLRCFGENGIKPDVILYGKPDSYVLLSSFINDKHVAPDVCGALRLLQEYYSEAIVVACSDEIASLMDLQFDSLCSHYNFFNCGTTGRLTHFMDKNVQSKVANEVGFITPKSVVGKPSEINPQGLPYPCIIKPLESIHGGKNIQICRQESDLSDALSAFDPREKVLVQEYIKKDYEIVVVGLSHNGTILIPAYIHKCRETMGGTTFSTVKPVDDLPTALLSSCKAMVEKMNYIGLFGIELIRQGDDYYFVEINLRNDATTYAISVAGCNLPLAYGLLCNGESANMYLAGPVRTINAMVEFQDFIHVLKRTVSLRTWVRQRKEAECRYCFSKTDIRAYRSQRSAFLKFLLRQVLNRFRLSAV